MKLFISYSHEDEGHKKKFEQHLSALTRQGNLVSWSDQDIIAGANLHNLIDQNLKECNVFIALVSPSYINSTYCFERELKIARLRESKNECTIVSIVIEPVSLTGLGFDALKMLPKDAKPVADHSNHNTAWAYTISQIADLIDQEIETEITPKKATLIWTEDTELVYQPRTRSSPLKLSELFVYPDMKTYEDEITEQTEVVSSSSLLNRVDHLAVIAEEQSGKTALSRQLTRQLHEEPGIHPVYMNMGEVKDNPRLCFEKACKTQYSRTPPTGSCVPIIDCVDVSIPEDNVRKLCHFLLGNFSQSIVFISDNFKLTSDLTMFEEFRIFELLALGNYKREELIANWQKACGFDKGLAEETFYREHVDPKKQYIDVFVARNIVPSKAIYILSILQVAETLTSQNVELTTHGHCYQHLITEALLRSGVKSEHLDGYVNYLTELAFRFYTTGKLDSQEVTKHNTNYDDVFIPVGSAKSMLDRLKKCGVLALHNDEIVFRYKYIYYFCVGKKIADKITTPSMKQEVDKLIQDLHYEEYANILLFVVHHTKDPSVIDDTMLALMDSFQNSQPARLHREDIQFLDDYVREAPKIVYKNRNHLEARKATNEAQDLAESAEKNVNEQLNDTERDHALAQLNRAIRSIEISGQIIRNRQRSLERDRLTEVAVEVVHCALRFLGFFLDNSENLKEELIEYLEKVLIAGSVQVSPKALEKEARSAMYFLTYSTILSVLKKVAFSAGSRDLVPIFRNIERQPDHGPSSAIIAAAVELNYQTHADIEELKKRFEKHRDNPVVQRMMQELLVHHLYLYPAEDFRVKQKIASAFRIPVKTQHSLARKRELKK